MFYWLFRPSCTGLESVVGVTDCCDAFQFASFR